MAQPISFTPKSVDPKLELERRLATAPFEHAEALLVAFDVLEEAHRQGVLDALHGTLRARDTIAGIAAGYLADPASGNSMRNLLALGKIVGTLDPDPIWRASLEMQKARETHREEKNPPSMWQLWRRMRDPDARRGLSLMTHLLAAIGRAAK